MTALPRYAEDPGPRVDPLLDLTVIRLNEAVAFADHSIREGHAYGLAGLREVERDLLAALHAAAPEYAALPCFRYAVDTLADLRKSIATEELIEGVPAEDMSLLVRY